jgi:hypothetical protein
MAIVRGLMEDVSWNANGCLRVKLNDYFGDCPEYFSGGKDDCLIILPVL